MLAKAKKETRLNIPVEFNLADFNRWEAARHKFDKIFSMESFYYFENVAAAIQKVHSLLKPDGIFACVVDFYEENKASEEWPRPEHCGVPMQRFDVKQWRQMFLDAGFKHVVQKQIRYPKEIAMEDWQAEVGSLWIQGEK